MDSHEKKTFFNLPSSFKDLRFYSLHRWNFSFISQNSYREIIKILNSMKVLPTQSNSDADPGSDTFPSGQLLQEEEPG